MGLVDGRKVYISRIDAATNTIELALWEELFKTEVWARNFNWLIDELREPIRASVRVRHTKWENPPCTATVEDGLVHIVCDEPVRAPAQVSPPCRTMAIDSSAAGSLCTDKDFLTKKK